MGFFSGTIEAIADGQTVHAAFLVDHHFNAGHTYNWTGLGTLTLDGHDWIGAGDVASIGPLPFGGDDAATVLEMKLSGVKVEYVTEARTSPSVRGRSQQVWLQFFIAATLAPLDTKYLLADRVMDVMGYSGVGPASRTITLTSEDVWTNRNTAEHANWSAADQEALFPGDKGLDFVAELVPGKRIHWPDFSV